MPLYQFLEKDFDLNEDDYKEYAYENRNLTLEENSTQINAAMITGSNITFEDYRGRVQSWMSWQDSFILTVFILLFLLSIGAIAAFKVYIIPFNHVQIK